MDDTAAKEIVTEFLGEVAGYLPVMRTCLTALQSRRDDRPAAEELHRICHTIKGAAAMVGLNDLSKTGELLEDTMEQVVASVLILDGRLIAVFREAVSRIEAFCKTAEQEGRTDSHLFKETHLAFQSARARRGAPLQPSPPSSAPAAAVGARHDVPLQPASAKDGDSLADILDQLLSGDVRTKAEDDFFLLDETYEERQARVTFMGLDLDIDPELLACFSEEAEKQLGNITAQLNWLTEAASDETEISPELRDSLLSLRRSVHTLKGAAAVIGIEPVAVWGRELEGFLNAVHDDFAVLRPETVAAMRQGCDLLARIATCPGCSAEAEQQAAARFREIVAREKAGPDKVEEARPEEAAAMLFTDEPEEESASVFGQPEPLFAETEEDGPSPLEEARADDEAVLFADESGGLAEPAAAPPPLFADFAESEEEVAASPVEEARPDEATAVFFADEAEAIEEAATAPQMFEPFFAAPQDSSPIEEARPEEVAIPSADALEPAAASQPLFAEPDEEEVATAPGEDAQPEEAVILFADELDQPLEPPFEPAPEDFFAEKKAEESPEALLDQLEETADDGGGLLQENEEEDIFAVFPELEEKQEEPAPPAEAEQPELSPAEAFFAEEESGEAADSLFDELIAETPADDSLFAAFPEPAPLPEPIPAAEPEDEPVDPELLECFSEETSEHLENIDAQLNQLDAAVKTKVAFSPDLRESLHSLRRSVHTLKGAAAVIGIKPVAAWGHDFEDFLDWLHDESPTLGPEAVSAMRDGADLLAQLTDEPGRSVAAEKEAVSARFKEIMAAKAAAPQPVPEAGPPPAAPEPEESAVAELFAEEPETQAEEPAASLFAAIAPDQSEAEESQSDEAIDPELLECFAEEAAEHLENIDRQLQSLKEAAQSEVELSPALRESLHSLRRSVHTLKGAAAVIGIQAIAAWGHDYEDFLDWLHDESPTLGPGTAALMQEAADLLAKITDNPALPVADKKEALAARFKKIMAGEVVELEPAPAAPEIEPAAVELPAPPPVQEETVAAPEPTAPPPAREAGGVRRINTLRVDVNRIDQVVGLSGDMVINLSSFEASMTAMSGTLNELGMILQRLKQINSSLEAGYELASIPHLSGVAEAGGGGIAEDFDPLEMDRYSELNILIRSLSEAVSDLDSIMAQSALENVAWQKTVERQERVLKEVQNRMIGLRMTPLSVLAARMQRTVREAEKTTGHPAQLLLEGESLMMDTRVWDTMADALMHILRNSVAHGGQPDKTLNVRIKAERRGGQFFLRISDDGKGLDYEAIRRKGMKLYPDENIGGLSDERLASLIFRHGFSSAGEITSIAGRGVGMDVVRDAVAQLNGATEIISKRGQGLQLLIRLPVAVAQLQAVLARLAGQVYAVPMHDIASVARIVAPAEAAAKEFAFAGASLPLIQPAAIPGFPVGSAGEPPAEHEQAVLVIQVGSRRAALLCEQLVGQKDIVFKELGAHLSHVSCVAGVTVLGDGSLVPIVQSEELVQKWIAVSGFAEEAVVIEQVEEKPLRILVVDDSISVRKVVSNFVAQQGWLPVVARNGIEAIERIREERPDFVLLDIEMPRMNGFEVLQALQGQAELRDLPVAMLTSRSADKYREKASQLGARGFLNKPFKEDEVIELVRRLTGR